MFKNFKKMTIGDIVFFALLITIFVFIAFLMIYPFWNLLVISFNLPGDYSRNGALTFFPREFSLVNYEYVFAGSYLSRLIVGAWNSVLRTIVGTVLNVFWCLLVSYALSRKYFILRKFMNVFVVVPMYVGAGLIPTFLLYKGLGLVDSFLVYIVPNLISAYNIIVLRTYMSDLPESLSEAAKIDGASEPGILFKVIAPLCIPSLATLCLFIAVFQWGAYQDTMFYANTNLSLTTLQYEMTKLVTGSATQSAIYDTDPTAETLGATVTIIATVPILCVYPFLQKYFVSGMTMGAVKE